MRIATQPPSKPPSWKLWLAFGIIYFVWGSTFLAIRIGVHELPPLLFAGTRFTAAGGILYVWARSKGSPPPTFHEWASAILLGALMFLISYGLLFWAEKRVPSGVAAVTLAVIPVFTAMAEILILRIRQLTVRLMVALTAGSIGVAVLVSRNTAIRQAPVSPLDVSALIVGAISWSVAAALTRRLPLPAAKTMSSAAQMLVGGLLLTMTAASLGEFSGFHVTEISRAAWVALAYLTLAGSIAGFTSYLWLVHHESPTKVSTYAYVNPIVAVFLGHFLGAEEIGPRIVIATLFTVVSVLLITTAPVTRGELEGRNECKPNVNDRFSTMWK